MRQNCKLDSFQHHIPSTSRVPALELTGSSSETLRFLSQGARRINEPCARRENEWTTAEGRAIPHRTTEGKAGRTRRAMLTIRQ